MHSETLRPPGAQNHPLNDTDTDDLLDVQSEINQSERESTTSRPLSVRKPVEEYPHAVIMSGAISTEKPEGDPLAPSASKFITTPDTESDLLASFTAFSFNRSHQGADITAVHTPDIGGNYPFTRRFVYSGRVSTTASTRPQTQDPNGTSQMRTNSFGIGVDESQFHQSERGQPAINSNALPILSGIVREMNGDQAKDTTALPSFDLSDLAEVIDRALRFVQIDSEKNEANKRKIILGQGSVDDKVLAVETFSEENVPQSDERQQICITAEEKLKIQLQIQKSIISDMGRRVDKFMRHNHDLLHQNRVLQKERDVAVQTKADLINLLEQYRKDGKPHPIDIQLPESDSKAALPRSPIQAGDNQGHTEMDAGSSEEDEIIDAAYNHLQKAINESRLIGEEISEKFRGKARVSFSEETTGQTTSTKIPLDPGAIESVASRNYNNKDWLLYEASLTSMKRRYEPPSTLGIGLMYQSTSYDLSKKNPYANVMKGKPSMVYTCNYHPQRLRMLIQNAEDLIRHFNKILTQQTNQLIKASSPEEYIELLQSYLVETKSLLHECLDALVEEQRAGRRWRGQCAKMYRELEKMRETVIRYQANESAIQKKRAEVFINAVDPYGRLSINSAETPITQIGTHMSHPSEVGSNSGPGQSKEHAALQKENQVLTGESSSESILKDYHYDSMKAQSRSSTKNDSRSFQSLPPLPAPITPTQRFSEQEDAILRQDVHRWILNPDDPSEVIAQTQSPSQSLTRFSAPKK